MTNGPHHLAKFDTTPDPSFHEEVVYRRCPFGARHNVTLKDLFLEIRWDDINAGLSVNRSKYSSAEDALWSFTVEDKIKKTCCYDEKRGKVYMSDSKVYPTLRDHNTGVSFKLIHTPENCNISHCEIRIENVPQLVDKPRKREIKAFLCSFFSELPGEDRTGGQA